MAEFKFSCPGCGQHIQCDVGYSGAQIACPSCRQTIIVPQAPPSIAVPSATPPPPPALGTRQSTAAPAAGRRFAGAPGAQPPVKPKSGALRNVIIITASVVILAGLGAGVLFFGIPKYKEHKAAQEAKTGNPAAQVSAPTATATIQALSILGKVHSAYTNLTTVRADNTVTLFLDLSNLTMADVNPNLPANAKNAKRHPPGMPRIITNTTELSMKRAQSNLYYFAGEAVSKIDRQIVSNTFAFWSSDKGRFMFTDSHMRGIPASYQQLPDMGSANDPSEQFKNMQHLFDDPANLTKIIKDLGQTDDESVNGQDCYTLTAKVLGQKAKIWVDKTSYLISQWQITLGGAISDADVDDAFSLVAAGFTNLPPAQLDMIKTQVKKMTPTMAKIRGMITSTSRNIETNPTFSADDFNYPVPAGVRLIPMFTPQRSPRRTATSTTSLEVQQRNACINNLRQIDAAKNEWSLEKGKANGTDVKETDITPYLAGGRLPTCPAGGIYTIGKVGENPTCSIPGHALP
jgi:outer membrane lipoprotein-sorting protein